MRNHLFIVTYGRTGSTLLLGILNSHPGIRITGENEGLFYQLYRSLVALDEFSAQRIPPVEDNPTRPFYGVSEFPFEKARDEISEIFDHFFPQIDGIETRGFKEIRYDMPDLENYLDFLADRYENTRFVFLTRDHQAVANSGFYRTTDPESIENYLTVLENRFDGYAKKNPHVTFHLRYEDLIDFGRITELFDFIGHNAIESHWRNAVSVKHCFSHRSVIEISTKSSLIIFDSAKHLIEHSYFEVRNHELRNISNFALTGILLPYEAAGSICALAFRSASASHHARIGIESPGYMKRYPHNPLAASARFSFVQDPLNLHGNSGDYDLVAAFGNGLTEIIGRLFIAPDQGHIV